MTTQETNTARAAGYSAQKIHWQNVKIHGVQTSCKKRLSYSGEGNKEFFGTLKNYPEMCCSKCADKFREYVRIQLNKKNES